jgi:hypothetical protein
MNLNTISLPTKARPINIGTKKCRISVIGPLADSLNELNKGKVK